MKKAYALIFDGYADWELGNVLPELRRIGKIDVASVGFSDQVVVSMGGLRVTPDMALSQIDPDDVLVFIVPGGYMWEDSYPKDTIEPLLHRLEAARTPIGAICAATTAIARAGLLQKRRHTSNSLRYLSKMVPDYAANNLYVDALAVRDRQVITASGLGAAEFTMEIMNELEIGSQEMRTMWYDAFKYGNYPEPE